MFKPSTKRSAWRRALIGFSMFASIGATGCQVDVGGQTLPSAHFLSDDVQHFSAGPEFKLNREAAEISAIKAEQQARANRQGGPIRR